MSRLLNIGTVKGAGAFEIERVVGREELSRLFEYRVDLISEKDDHKPEDILGTNATIGIEMPGGADPRFLNGYVSRFSVLGQVKTPAFKTGTGFRYQATLSPWLWFLTRTSTCAIFQNKKMLEVIEEVLGRAAELKSLENKVKGETETREYCVQYRETDFNFFSRLMEQAGLYYFFTHEDGKHKLVLTDDPAVHVPLPGSPELRFSAGSLYDASLKSWVQNSEVQPGAYAINDFDFKKPNTSLLKVSPKERSHKNAGFELFDYPGEYVEPTWGSNYAKFRIEELYCQHEVSRGSGVERGIRAGYKFKLADHPIGSLNKEYLVIAHSFTADNNLVQSGGVGGAIFDCSFAVIPAPTQFRPPRLTPLPTIPGLQTAFVVGPEGEEIYTDEFGRVKVQFHWDRYSTGSDKDSCWMRVSNPFAGKGWGAINIPRVGQEVIVQFMEGDPDRPLITGRVYNGEDNPPYKMPDKKMYTGMKTRSYPNGSNEEFNELRFDDSKGKEQIYLQAQKWMDFRVKSTFKQWIGGSSNTYVAGSMFTKTNTEKHLTSKGDMNVTVKEGLLSVNVKQKILVDSEALIALQAKDQITLRSKTIGITGTQAIQASTSDFYATASGDINLNADNIFITGKSSIQMKVGGSIVVLDASGVTIVGSMVKVNSGGSANAAEKANEVPTFTPKDAKLPAIAMNSAGGEKSAPPKPRTKPKAYSGQASAFKVAAKGGGPFVEPCEEC
jgi:type VI secretion system secreted protein VgrG